MPRIRGDCLAWPRWSAPAPPPPPNNLWHDAKRRPALSWTPHVATPSRRTNGLEALPGTFRGRRELALEFGSGPGARLPPLHRFRELRPRALEAVSAYLPPQQWQLFTQWSSLLGPLPTAAAPHKLTRRAGALAERGDAKVRELLRVVVVVVGGW